MYIVAHTVGQVDCLGEVGVSFTSVESLNGSSEFHHLLRLVFSTLLNHVERRGHGFSEFDGDVLELVDRSGYSDSIDENIIWKVPLRTSVPVEQVLARRLRRAEGENPDTEPGNASVQEVG